MRIKDITLHVCDDEEDNVPENKNFVNLSFDWEDVKMLYPGITQENAENLLAEYEQEIYDRLLRRGHELLEQYWYIKYGK